MKLWAVVWMALVTTTVSALSDNANEASVRSPGLLARLASLSSALDEDGASSRQLNIVLNIPSTPPPYPTHYQNPPPSQYSLGSPLNAYPTYAPVTYPASYGYEKIEPLKIIIPAVKKCKVDKIVKVGLKKLFPAVKKALLLKKILFLVGKKKFPPVVPIPIPVGCVPAKKKPKGKKGKNPKKANGKKRSLDEFMERQSMDADEDEDESDESEEVFGDRQLRCPPGTVRDPPVDPEAPPVDPEAPPVDPGAPPTPSTTIPPVVTTLTPPTPPTTPSTPTTYRPYWPPPAHPSVPVPHLLYPMSAYPPPEREPIYAYPPIAYPGQPVP